MSQQMIPLFDLFRDVYDVFTDELEASSLVELFNNLLNSTGKAVTSGDKIKRVQMDISVQQLREGGISDESIKKLSTLLTEKYSQDLGLGVTAFLGESEEVAAEAAAPEAKEEGKKKPSGAPPRIAGSKLFHF